MIIWHPHTEAPIGESVVAIIAATAPTDGHRYIMPEQYLYNATECEWIGERTGLLLRPTNFFWATAVDLLGTLPAVPELLEVQIMKMATQREATLRLFQALNSPIKAGPRYVQYDRAVIDSAFYVLKQMMTMQGYEFRPADEPPKVGAGETAEVAHG